MDRYNLDEAFAMAQKIHEDKQAIQSLMFDLRLKEEELKIKLIDARAIDLLTINYSRLRMTQRRLNSK